MHMRPRNSIKSSFLNAVCRYQFENKEMRKPSRSMNLKQVLTKIKALGPTEHPKIGLALGERSSFEAILLRDFLLFAQLFMQDTSDFMFQIRCFTKSSWRTNPNLL